MNIAFIYSLYNIASPLKPLQTPEVMQFGISYMSSFLKKHGHDTRLIVLSRTTGKKNEEILNNYIKDFKPRLICFTAVSSEYDFILSLARYVKKYFPGIYLLAGGAHISLNPDGVLDVFDALCIGEGERPALELATQLEKGIRSSGIQNLWIKNGVSVQKNPTRPFLQELDQLPFPDRKIWEEWTDPEPDAVYSVLLGRGCIFECTYCCNHSLKKIASGTYTRFRTAGNILEEIKELSNKISAKREIYLEVENFCLNMHWALELCSKLESFNKTLKKPLSFGTNIRITPNLKLNDLFSAFRKSGFRFINVGLESGSPRVRKEILKRNYSNEDIAAAVRCAREHGLQVSFLNLVGIPGETLSDFKETIAVNRACLPDWVGASIFYPYPGTDLYSTCKNLGLLNKPVSTEKERKLAVLDLPGFTKKQIQNSYIWFEFAVYKGHRPLRQLLMKVLYLKIIITPPLFFLYNMYKKIRKSTA